MNQIPLFLDENILINTADEAFAALRLEEALKGYQTYADLYGASADVDRKRKLLDFLSSGISDIRCADINFLDNWCGLWDSVADYAENLGLRKESLLPDIKKSFFRHAAKALSEHHNDRIAHIGNFFPAGYVYLQTGDYEKAVTMLRERIATSPGQARCWGYLGDAFYLGGSIVTAGQCYFQAFLIDPAALDWRHLQNRQLLSLRRELKEEHSNHEKNGAAWIAVQAYLRNIIFPKHIDQKLRLVELAERYLEREKASIENPQAETAAQIFLIGIVLCDHEPLLRRIEGVDFLTIRARMKDINPTLFAKYLQIIEKRESRHYGSP